MPRPPSKHVRNVKEQLVLRLRDGYHRPGDRFLSNRAVAERFGISYQTAHRLIGELVADGLLERRDRSGTLVAGEPVALKGAELIFNERARRKSSFGARLLAELTAALKAANLPHHILFRKDNAPWSPNGYLPVLWETPSVLDDLARSRHWGLLLAQESPPGLASGYLDSIFTDDFSGGVAAGQIMREHGGPRRRVCVVGGPPHDKRSNDRIRGFRSILPRCSAVFACGWYYKDGAAVADAALARGPDGIFCCNDRLAEAILARTSHPPPLILGFDDAPVAAELALNTIAIPWGEIAQAAAGIIRARLAGHAGTPRQQIFAPRPILRSLPAQASG